MKEDSEVKKQGNSNSQFLAYASIGAVCIVLCIFFSGCIGQAPAATPVVNAVASPAPAPSPSVAAPVPPLQVPSPEPSVVAAQPTVEAAVPSIDDLGPAVEAAANKALAARNSSKTITLNRLTYNVGPLTNPSRTYYQGDVVTLFQNGSNFVAVNLEITVYDVLKGEVNQHPVSASSVLDINGRKVSISGSDADFTASMPCLGGSVYVYAEETGRTFTARELYEQVAAVCPA